MAKRIILTAALVYANGPLHIGHLVEYIQADIITKALRLLGKNVTFVCADDTHGAPIEISASQAKVTPQELIAKYHKEHAEDFASFYIDFDSYETTNSEQNRHFAELFFKRMQKKKLIYEKEVELNYCAKCKRFLPDRYIKGRCPKCGAEDQYGDVCEKCNAAYKTTDLVEPFCAVCKGKPVIKSSKNYFFRLSKFSRLLEDWLKENKELQPEIRNQILNWIKEGLQDWSISREAPYFGFKIPDTDKYFYVWFDAPIGYLASFSNLLGNDVKKAEKEWNNSEIMHIIGKDIIYFHLLFWPAMLMAAGMKLPSNVLVHGFLTINKEKMSKSRGTYFTAREFLGLGEPEHLRYYYASNLSRSMTDLDLDFKDYENRINNELVSNIANFIYRTLSFCSTYLEGMVCKEHDKNILAKAKEQFDSIMKEYGKFQLRNAVKGIVGLSSYGNRYFQEKQPWILIKDNKEEAGRVIATCVNIVKYLIIALKPVLPNYCANIEEQLKLAGLKPDKDITEHSIGAPLAVFTKIQPINVKHDVPFSKLNLKVAEVLEVREIPDADKLYVLQINLGTEKRQIVAGIRKHYTKEQLKGKKIIVVANLEPAKLRGQESNGMLLAGEEGGIIGILYAEKAASGDQVLVEGAKPNEKQIKYDDFKTVQLHVQDGKVLSNGKLLKVKGELVKVDRIKNGLVK